MSKTRHMTDRQRKVKFDRSSVVFHESRGCDFQNKKSFATRGQARHCASVATKRYGKLFSEYQCQACKQWHLTTTRIP
jgi:hypothetical protein